jgi:hypothetical protein
MSGFGLGFHRAHLQGSGPAWGLKRLKPNSLPGFERPVVWTGQVAEVNEYLAAAVIRRDETVAFLGVKPLHDSSHQLAHLSVQRLL